MCSASNTGTLPAPAPSAVFSAGFAFSPPPRRSAPISGSALLGPALPDGSPLAEALSSAPPGTSSGSTVVTSPLRKPPLAPSAQLARPEAAAAAATAAAAGAAAVEDSTIDGNGTAVQEAARALEAVSVQDHGQPAAGAARPLRSEKQEGSQRRRSPSVHGRIHKGPWGESYPSPWRDPRLFIVASGHGSPCLDLRRVSRDVVDAAAGTDLGKELARTGEGHHWCAVGGVTPPRPHLFRSALLAVCIEGMGRSVHTNWTALFKCDALKLSMIKNQHLAETLFGGHSFECVCRFDEGLGY